MDPKLRRLGQVIARTEQDELEAFDLEAQRARFLLDALSTPRHRRVRPGRGAWAGLVAAAIFLSIVWLWPRPVSFEVAGEQRRPGEWIAAPLYAALALEFSEGSQLSLGPNARARVVDNSARGARVVLERGKLQVRVVHRDDTRWRVDAGPFAVYVVGTRFDVAWEDERFELDLHEGAVRVVGPTLREGRVIRAGEQLKLSVAPVPQVTSMATSAPLRNAAEPRAPEPVALPSAQPAKAVSSWRWLALSGAYERAFRALEQEGFDSVIERVGSGDLKVVVDLARLSHHPEHAQRGLRALLARFPRAHEAQEATFLLGRLAFDQRAEPAEAARWFTAYLEAYPEGAFRREANGRLIECYERLDDAKSAARSAQDYMAMYASGPHAALAKAVLARTHADGGELP